MLFDMNSKKYWSLGGEIAKCWDIGKQLKTWKPDDTNRTGEIAQQNGTAGS